MLSWVDENRTGSGRGCVENPKRVRQFAGWEGWLAPAGAPTARRILFGFKLQTCRTTVSVPPDSFLLNSHCLSSRALGSPAGASHPSQPANCLTRFGFSTQPLPLPVLFSSTHDNIEFQHNDAV